MAVQLSTDVRNARLDQIESTVGTAALLRIRTGTQPATCATADSGTVLAELALPSDWMQAASGGTKDLLGTWQDASADNTGTAGHWRLYNTAGSTCHAQGSITASGGGGDLQLLDVNLTATQPFTITTWSFTDGNP